MRIQTLWDKYKGSEIWVVGTGPSMRLLPSGFLKDKITIGVNQAWRYGPLTYCLTVHPELVLEYQKDPQRLPTQWLIKKKPPLERLELDDPDHYVFHSTEDLAAVIHRVNDTLYVGRGGQCTAMSLAAHMGAKTVYLVGCDMCDLAGEHHGHDQHVRFHGLSAQSVYAEMRHFTAKVRALLRDRLGVTVVTVTPFVGAGHADEDYKRLCRELKLPRLPKPKDTSPYRRRKTDR